ncbi:MAG: SDR family oxidoreductase, partial [Elusimicrobia bacterium]|nr:SDR family oxidoreductase [Elusimicrobiota bacterium]
MAVSGAVGSAIVPVLLGDPALRLILLLRPAPGCSVEERFEILKKYWAGYRLDDSVWRRVDVLTGDVAQERLGLSLETFRTLAKKVADETHCPRRRGGELKRMPGNPGPHESSATTCPALRLAQEVRGLEKLEYLSTVGVAGTMEGAIAERRVIEFRSFHNTYESSKAEAEDLCGRHGKGLPVTIHRPSMVVGDSRDGRTLHFQVFYHLMEFLSGRVTAGWVPRLPSFRLD